MSVYMRLCVCVCLLLDELHTLRKGGYIDIHTLSIYIVSWMRSLRRFIMAVAVMHTQRQLDTSFYCPVFKQLSPSK